MKETLTALKVYHVGKPIVVEEICSLSCSLSELEEFIHGAEGIAEGWISHYFGKSVADYRKQTDLRSSQIAQFLEFWQAKAPQGRGEAPRKRNCNPSATALTRAARRGVVRGAARQTAATREEATRSLQGLPLRISLRAPVLRFASAM